MANEITMPDGRRVYVPKKLKEHMTAVDIAVNAEAITTAIQQDGALSIYHKGLTTGLGMAQLSAQVLQELESLGPVAEPYHKGVLELNHHAAQAVIGITRDGMERVWRISKNGHE